MAPLIILITVTLALLVGGRLGIGSLRHPALALRGGLAAMFTATGVSHFVGMRPDLIAMVPPGLPAPGLLVTITGVLELLAVAGLLWQRRTARWAATGLTALLVVMFPANVHAALAHQSSAFEDQLIPRTIMQLVFLAATIAVIVRARPTETTPESLFRPGFSVREQAGDRVHR